ncbi:Phosphotransferase system IIC components, glucose/maltose/N-acetylglucosamine-specific [Seinonella peptonophila]|uniref:Phosphotransferase system IIC components, glucose/maltose/N-acetylglucosamine-specific n=1 Tax=Seinonella peptonophila TaxID=112248 RepID=A0A1M4ZG67_9BACL|nr:PTS sugar transporter [Seinonella peptonophila]SHF16576.1 Phosphotransferase system IIC components, glucose/maltose/N-acetylglucosamine-specific [Seinonella peptonophila]
MRGESHLKKRIGIIGSSGGNLFQSGGNLPEQLLNEMLKQCQAAELEIKEVQFIAATASMDQVKETTSGRLYRFDSIQQNVIEMVHGTLKEVNQQARTMDQKIAELIDAGEIDGLIMMSADPRGVNQKTVQAAAGKQIPIVGTGGTSMSLVTAAGANVIATSGTTGTTNRTRAISFISSLSKHWQLKYRPVIGTTAKNEMNQSQLPWQRIRLQGMMMAALPGFIALALILALSKIPGLQALAPIFDLLIKALPIMLAAIAARQISGLDEIATVAGILAGVLSVDGGIIGGMIGGIVAGLLLTYLFQLTVRWNFPATTVNIIAGSFAGLLAGLLGKFLIAPAALEIGKLIRSTIEILIHFSPVAAGAVAGLLIWPAILGGVYHAAILPIVLLEMEKTGHSFLGAVDMTGLVMVSAGITLANIIVPKKKSDVAAASPGFLINMGFGTFVEAAYPFMFSNRIVFAGAIFSAGFAGMLVGLFDVRGTAYVPSFTAPFLSNHPWGFVIAMLGGLLSAFIITAIANRLASRQANQEAS